MSALRDQLKKIKIQLQEAREQTPNSDNTGQITQLGTSHPIKDKNHSAVGSLQENLESERQSNDQKKASLRAAKKEEAFRKAWIMLKNPAFLQFPYEQRKAHYRFLKNQLPQMTKHSLFCEVKKFLEDLYIASRASSTLNSSGSKSVPTSNSQVSQSVPVPTSFLPIAKKTLQRKQQFCFPSDWVELGCLTQAPNITPTHSRSIDVYIGLDFGTSFTKAAVGFSDKIYPVDWELAANSTNMYLLPSEYTTDIDGKAYLGQHPDSNVEDLHADLKLPFMEPIVFDKSIQTASVFLGLVLKYIRAWVYKRHLRKLNGSHIRWHLNVGIPSDGFEDKRMKGNYDRLVKLSWKLSTYACINLNLVTTQEIQSQLLHLEQNDLSSSSLHPEFVGQMAGYIQSAQRVRGLHALVDVGGGTLDVVTFNVHDVNGDDKFPFLVPQVEALGTHKLLQNRFAGIQREQDRLFIAADGDESIASQERFSSENEIDLAHVKSRDEIFRMEVSKLIGSVFGKTKSKRYRLAPEWKYGVRTFFTGGGANLQLYQNALSNASIPGNSKLIQLKLPKHTKLDEFKGDSADYQRISVACGLAQDAWNLPSIVPAKEVQNDSRVRLTVRELPTRDELYSK